MDIIIDASEKIKVTKTKSRFTKTKVHKTVVKIAEVAKLLWQTAELNKALATTVAFIYAYVYLQVNPGVGFGIVRDDSKLPSQTKKRKMRKQKAQRAARKVARQQSKARLIAKRARRVVAAVRRSREAARQLLILKAARAVVESIYVAKRSKLAVKYQPLHMMRCNVAKITRSTERPTVKANMSMNKLMAYQAKRDELTHKAPSTVRYINSKLRGSRPAGATSNGDGGWAAELGWETGRVIKPKSLRREKIAKPVAKSVVTSIHVYPDIVAAMQPDNLDAASLAAMAQGASLIAGMLGLTTPAPLVSTTVAQQPVVEDSKNKGENWQTPTQITPNKETNMREPLVKINDSRLNLITELVNTSGVTKDLPVDKLVAICVGMSKEDEYGNIVSANVNGTLPLNVEHEASERWFNMAFGELHSEGVNRVFGGFDTVVNKDAAPIAFTTAQVREVYEYNKKGQPTLGAAFRSAYMSSVYKFPMPAQLILDTQNFGAKGTTPSEDVAMVRGTIRDLILAGESGNVGDISVVGHKPLAESLSDLNNRMPDGKGGYSRRKLYLVVANATEHVVNEKGYARQERYYCDEIHIYEILEADYESLLTEFGKFNDEFLVACGLLDVAKPVVKPESVAPKVEVVVEQPVVPRKPPVIVVEAKVDTPVPPRSPVQLSERYREFIAINRARDPVANLKRNDAAVDASVLFTDANLRSAKGTFTDSVIYNLLVGKYGKAAVAGNVSGQNIALACRYYIESHVSPTEADSKGNIDFSNYRWTIGDVLHIFHIINLMATVFRLKGHSIVIEEITGGVSIEFSGNEIRFTLMNDLAYSTRGQCFLPTIEHVVDDKDDVSEVKLVSSIGNFVKLLYLGYIPLVAQWQSNKASNTCTNLEEFINAASQMVNLSTDEVMSQGAALHTILNTYKPVIHCEVNPCANHKWVNLGMSPARQLSRKYLATYGKQVSVSNKVLKSGIKHALDTYGMTTDINKSSYVRGSLGHIDLAVIAKTAPSVYADIVAYIGANAANVANLINIGTKIEKGIKRIRLSLAQAAAVRNAVLMGWKLTGMRSPGHGALVNTCYLLNHVIAPGQSYFIGDESEMPTAVVPTTTKGYALYEWDAENILDFESTILEYEPKELTMVNNWQTYTFTGNPVAITGSGKELLATVKNAAGVKLPIVHESHKTGNLISIGYRIVDDIVKGAKKLLVRWTIEREEHFGKIRSIVKAQLVLAGKEILYNSFNTNIPAGIQAVHFQDGIKSDVLYSWLMVAGNTVAHNQGNPKIARLEALVRKANVEVMGRDQADYLHLDAHALVSATYKEVLAEFEAVFGRIVWSYHPFVGDQGKAMWEIYNNHPKWSSDTTCLNDHELEQLFNLERVTVRTNGKDDKASVLIFVRNEAGVITDLYQRGFGFVGIEGCPLLNVELFESSTVNQSVSGSRQMASFIRALGVVAKDSDAVYQEQLDMLDETENVLLEAKMMNAFASANDFDLVVDGVVTKKRIINLEYFSASGVDEGGNQFGKVSIDDATYLTGLLADVDLTDLNDSTLFKQVAAALRNVVFKLQGSSLTSIWLPGLYAFSHLTGNAISTESVTGMVFYTVVLPLLRGAALPSIAINRVRGKIDAYISGAEFIKLLKGRKSAGAKRVANNHLAAGQTMILFSSVADSAFQEFLRNGVDVYAALAGEVVLVNGNRCPIAAGTVSRLYVAIQHEDGTQTCNGINNGEPLFYKVGPDQIAISCMMVYIDGGDFDGDGHYCTVLKNVDVSEVHTFEDIARLCAASLGVDNMFKVEKQYATDHYGIKDYYKCMENLSHGLVKSIQKASKVKDDRKLLADPANDETYLETLQKSYEMFAVSTGKAYDVYMLGEHIINIVQGYAKAGLEVPESMRCLTKPGALSLVLVISQLYEIILGGYNKSTWPMWAEYLYHTISEANRVIKGDDIVKFNAACKGMGINVVDIEDLATIYNLVRLCVCMEKADTNRQGVNNSHLDAVNELSIDEQFILSSALVAFELSRGKFEGFSGSFRPMKYSAMARGHRRALMTVVKFLNENSGVEVYNKAFNNSLVILSIFKILDIIGDELTQVCKTVVRNHEYNIDEEVAGGLIKATFKSAHLDYFTSKLGDDVVEDDEDLPEEDNGDGGSTPPVEPEGNGGGNQVEEPVTVTPRAPAERVVEATKFVGRGVTPVSEAPVVFEAEQVVQATKFVGRPVVVEEPVIQATKFVPREVPAVLEEDGNDYETTIIASRFIARNVGGESPLPYIEEIKEDDIEMATIVRAPNNEGVRVEQDLYPESLFEGLNVKQRDTFLQVLYGKSVYLEGEGGTGKLQPLEEPVLTPNGWTTIGELKIGDNVISQDGKPTEVLNIFEGKDLNIYRIEFTDGTWTECCEDHLWNVQTSKLRELNKYRTMTLKDMLPRINVDRTNTKYEYYYSIPVNEAVEFDKQEVELNAYLLGWLLGDGYLPEGNQQVVISTWNVDTAEIVSLLKPVLNKDVTITEQLESPSGKNVRKLGFSVGIKTYLENLGLLGQKSLTKFVPKSYMYNTVEIRKAILAGLLDTDGTVGVVNNVKKKVRFNTGSKQLQLDVAELVRSLGGLATTGECLREDKENVEYVVNIRLPFNPFRLSRKAELYNKYDWSFSFIKKIKAAVYVGKKDGRCLSVANPSHLYLTRDYIVTHNTYTSQRITDYMRANGWDVFKTGSTGTSVMNIDGDGTLNSVLALGTGFNPDNARSTADQANDLYTASKSSDAVKKLFKNKNKKLFFSIDEIFMVDSRLFWVTVKVLTELAAEKGFKLQWLISGDPLQLGVVKGIDTFKDALLVDGYAKNHNKGIVIDTFKKCILTKIERQDNVEFITDLSLVRQGCAAGPVIQERLEASKPRVFPESAVHTYATNKEVSKHNNTVLDRLIAEGNDDFTFNAEVQNYNGNDRKWVAKLEPIEEYMKVVKGMSVMFRMNLKASNEAIEIVSTPKGYEYTSDKLITANGTVGIVKSINIGFKPYSVNVLLSTGVEIKVKQTALNVESKRDGTPKGKFVQLPFHASHALTYWKLQGLTLDVPLVVHQYWLDYQGRIKELSAGRHCGAMYVACSRVTRPELLWFGIGGETGYQLLTASTHVNKEAQIWLSQQ